MKKDKKSLWKAIIIAALSIGSMLIGGNAGTIVKAVGDVAVETVNNI